MYEALNQCKHLLTKFGGHTLAAGLSMDEENVDRFRNVINAQASLTEDDLTAKVSIDMQLPLQYVTEQLVEELSLLEPFGKGNTKPIFVEKNIEILKANKLGKNQNVLKMQVRDEQGSVIDAMYFGDIEGFETYLCQKFSALQVSNMWKGQRIGMKLAFTYYPTINEYMGRKNVQIVIQNYQ
jgi:single-stranded-DNA-specific exonuclease